jgi:SH3 domain protein
VIRMQRFGQASALAAVLATAVVGLATTPGVAGAEAAWIRAELRLNLRTGPGTSYRIVGTLETGDGVTVLERAEKWTKVELAEGNQGWIPAGYLQSEAPPTIRLGQLEREVVELRGQLETVTSEREQLADTNTTLSSSDDQQNQQIADLSRENARLKGGQRWPEWITGAGVLCVGMILGALWSRSTGRRSSPRIRL